MADSDSRIEMVTQVLDAMNKHNPVAAARNFTETCVLDSHRGPYPHGQRFSGKSAVEGAFRSFFNRVPDAVIADPEILAVDERVFVLAKMTGRSMTGERLNQNICEIYEFDDDQISRLDTYWKRPDRH
jgi:ketosteroid isomerase-like protein